MKVVLISALTCGALLVGCGSSGVTEGDQKANEAKYSQAGYEEAMKKAGRSDELATQKKLQEERQGDR